MIFKDFKNIFVTRETQAIRGQKNKNFIILTVLLFATFIAIGFAIGGLEYLSIKMNDPFVQNLEIKIPYKKAMKVDIIKWQLNQDTLMDNFDYDTILSHIEYPLIFWHGEQKDNLRVKGRSIENGDPLLEQILGKRNLIKGRGFTNNQDCGFIVTEKFLKRFGYKGNDLFIQMSVATHDRGYVHLPVPIIAVVEELPSLSSFAYTPYFYQCRTGPDNPYLVSDHTDLTIFIASEDEAEVRVIQDYIDNFFANHSSYSEMDPDSYYVKNSETYQPGYNLITTFFPVPESQTVLEDMYTDLISSNDLKQFQNLIYRYYQYDFPMYPEKEIPYDVISVNFNSLKKVNEFKEFLYNTQELDIEMSKVRDKENFKTISILTISIAVLVLIFSIISIGLFVYNLLKSHLDKVKMNIGTFKAFGLSNQTLESIYKSIIRRFFFQCLLIAYSIALFINILCVAIFFSELSFFQLINIYVIIGIVFMWMIVFQVYKITSAGILKNTPGDLIYGRDQS